MGRVARKLLIDKDIRELQPKSVTYRVVVGNPSELYLFVYPSGNKSFFIRKHYKFYKVGRFRQAIYNVSDAREDANAMLRIIETGGDLDSTKYLFKNLYTRYIRQKHKQGLSKSYIEKIEALCERYLLPNLAEIDVKDIKFSYLLDLLNAIFEPNNPQKSRLETIKRLSLHLNGIFNIALKDRYIDYNPTFGLRQEFPTKSKFYLNNDIDSRLPALIDENELKAFLYDLKHNTALDSQVKNALYLQILCVNRPINTACAKWIHIDLDSALWIIPAKEMKTQTSHSIALNSYALEILKHQKEKTARLQSAFVFPAFNNSRHINRNRLNNALQRLENGKYKGRVTAHGFRATFRTISTLHKAQLLQKGISDEVIESALAHKTENEIKFAYEREKASLKQKRILMQWYGDYLNALCEFEFGKNN